MPEQYELDKLPVVSEQYELCSNRIYIDVNKSLASSIVVTSIFVIHFVNGAQFLNPTLNANLIFTSY